MDAGCTPMGKRLLRASILRPMIDLANLSSRYEAVDAARQDLIRREELRRALQGILDLDRLLARISLDSAGPRDVLALAASLQHLPAVRTAAASLTKKRVVILSGAEKTSSSATPDPLCRTPNAER